jgi:hypothetical protein
MVVKISTSRITSLNGYQQYGARRSTIALPVKKPLIVPT